MICYRLHCVHGHEFEAWFAGAETFETQARNGQVLCPQCGTPETAKSLMAPAVARIAADPAQISPGDQVRMALRTLRRHIETSCDDMGDRFAEEALRRHDEEERGGGQPERGIYGTMNDSERERLEDEGVAFTAVPWVDHSDA